MTDEVRLTFGDLHEIGGVTRATLDRMAEAEAVCPQCGGGRGHHKTYGLIDHVIAKRGESGT